MLDTVPETGDTMFPFAGDLLVTADLDAIRAAGRETSTVVVFTNGDAIKSVKLEQTGSLAAKTAVAKVEL